MPHYKFDQIAYNITDKKMPVPGDEKMYIGLEHLDSGSLKVSRWGSEVELTGQKLVMKKGDILFGRRNTYLRRAAIAPHDGIFSAHGMIFRPKTDVMDPEYFPFFISSNYFMDAAIRISVGSLSPTVNWKTLKELEFDIPSLEEQRKNAALLASINETKEAYQELLLQTDNLVKSQFIEMFGNGLHGNEKFPLSSMKEVCSVIQDGEHSTVKRVDEGHLFLSARNVKLDHNIVLEPVTYVDDERFAKIRKRFAPQAGDVLLTCAGTIGNAAVVPDMEPFVADRGVTMLRPQTGILNSQYLLAFFSSDFAAEQMRRGTKATALAHLYLKQINELRIILPPIDLQNQFANFVKQTDKSKFELKKAIESCNALMKAILFTNLEEKED